MKKTKNQKEMANTEAVREEPTYTGVLKKKIKGNKTNNNWRKLF